MSAYRCNPCSTNWPPSSDYNPCPECEGKTDFFSNTDSIDADEALSRKKHADFERFWEERESKRQAAESKALADELDRITRGTN